MLTNSIKYSFPSIESPIIRIDVEQIGSTIIFKITYIGLGFNYISSLTDKTIGLAILKDIEKSLNAKLQTPTIGNPNYILEFSEE